MQGVITLDGVVKRYGQLTAVDGISLEIPHGRAMALLGANGAGKSTMAGLLMGLLRPGGRGPGGSPRC